MPCCRCLSSVHFQEMGSSRSLTGSLQGICAWIATWAILIFVFLPTSPIWYPLMNRKIRNYRSKYTVGQPDHARPRRNGVVEEKRGQFEDMEAEGPKMLNTVIVGGGASGLAMALELEKNNVTEYIILEHGPSVGGAWTQRYSRLHLHSAKVSSALPGIPFPEFYPRFVSREQLAAYYEGVARMLPQGRVLTSHTVLSALPITSKLRSANTLSPSANWLVTARTNDSGEVKTYQCENLVCCTGQETEPFYPPVNEKRDSFNGEVTHTHFFKNGEQYRGKDVVIIGFGNSAAEIGMDCWEHGAKSVTLLSRSDTVHLVKRESNEKSGILYNIMRKWPIWFLDRLAALGSRSEYPDLKKFGFRKRDTGMISDGWYYHESPLVDIGIWKLIQEGEVNAIIGEICDFGADHVILKSGERLHADSVIWGTGFKKGTAVHQKYLPEDICNGVIDPNYNIVFSGREAYPNLYFVGFNDVLGRLAEINLEAENIALEIQKRGTA